MADTGRRDDDQGDKPSLEMPSLSLRRRKRAPKQETAPDPAHRADPAAPAPAAEDPVQIEDHEEDPEEAPEEAPDDAAEEATRREPRPRRGVPLPAVSGLPAAVVTGVVVGGLAVLLAWLATAGCSAVRGTSSCGGGPGLLILVGVLVVLAYAGSWLLGRFGVPEAGSTSLLAVGIMAVLVMVFLLGSTDEWWMVVAIPAVTVIAYGLSWRVTTAVVDADTTDEPPVPHDVR